MKIINLFNLLILTIILSSFSTYAVDTLEYENKYLAMDNYFLGTDSNIYIDYVWDHSISNNSLIGKSLSSINVENLHQDSLLRLILLSSNNSSNVQKLKMKFLTRLVSTNRVSNRVTLLLLNYKDIFEKIFGESIISEILLRNRNIQNIYTELGQRSNTPDNKEIKNIFTNSPELRNGGIKLFLFCRTNRKFPCRFLMKNSNNEVVLDSTGEIWSQKALASSKHDYPFNVRNGNTPTGIFKINSVMPKANRKLVYGKFRRFILEFIPKSKNEKIYKSYLPSSSLNKTWWKENLIAREVGRNLFRIHGTGLRSKDVNATFYPFVRTSGCVAQRENSYQNNKYIDQRHLLDTAMLSMGLDNIYQNETKIKGLLYIVNINNKEQEVSLTELKNIIQP